MEAPSSYTFIFCNFIQIYIHKCNKNIILNFWNFWICDFPSAPDPPGSGHLYLLTKLDTCLCTFQYITKSMYFGFDNKEGGPVRYARCIVNYNKAIRKHYLQFCDFFSCFTIFTLSFAIYLRLLAIWTLLKIKIGKETIIIVEEEIKL